MNTTSVSINAIKLQEAHTWKYEMTRYVKSLIYCPMCECLHENNSMCQMDEAADYE